MREKRREKQTKRKDGERERKNDKEKGRKGKRGKGKRGLFSCGFVLRPSAPVLCQALLHPLPGVVRDDLGGGCGACPFMRRDSWSL